MTCYFKNNTNTMEQNTWRMFLIASLCDTHQSRRSCLHWRRNITLPTPRASNWTLQLRVSLRARCVYIRTQRRDWLMYSDDSKIRFGKEINHQRPLYLMNPPPPLLLSIRHVPSSNYWQPCHFLGRLKWTSYIRTRGD